MGVNSVKNMVVLKNLPSNLVEEAIVILKSNAKVKNAEMIDNLKSFGGSNNKEENKDYVLKEAQMLVNDYVSKIEDNKKPVKKVNVKRLKAFAYISTIVAIIEGIIII